MLENCKGKMRQNIDNLTTEEIGKIFPIEVVAFREEWDTIFNIEKILIVNTLDDLFEINIEHMGSTAVQGLASKPVIDILIEIPLLTNKTKIAILAKLREIGYENMCNAEQEKQMTLGKGYDLHKPDKQKFHVHIREKSADCQDEISFRDYLKNNINIRKEYETLKMDLAKKYRYNREDYTLAKTDFVTRITKMAKKSKKQ